MPEHDAGPCQTHPNGAQTDPLLPRDLGDVEAPHQSQDHPPERGRTGAPRHADDRVRELVVLGQRRRGVAGRQPIGLMRRRPTRGHATATAVLVTHHIAGHRHQPTRRAIGGNPAILPGHDEERPLREIVGPRRVHPPAEVGEERRPDRRQQPVEIRRRPALRLAHQHRGRLRQQPGIARAVRVALSRVHARQSRQAASVAGHSGARRVACAIPRPSSPGAGVSLLTHV